MQRKEDEEREKRSTNKPRSGQRKAENRKQLKVACLEEVKRRNRDLVGESRLKRPDPAYSHILILSYHPSSWFLEDSRESLSPPSEIPTKSSIKRRSTYSFNLSQVLYLLVWMNYSILLLICLPLTTVFAGKSKTKKYKCVEVGEDEEVRVVSKVSFSANLLTANRDELAGKK